MFAGKEVRIFLKGDAKEAYEELKKRDDKEAKALLKSIERVIAILKDNPQYGDPVTNKLVPAKYKKLRLNNLYRAELSNFWRMLYTVEGNTIEIFVFVLDITDHAQYNKLFGYK